MSLEIDVDDNTPLSDSVASLSFKEDNAILSYPLSTMNKERKAETTINKTFTYEVWKENFRNRKTVFGWIKPTNDPTGEQRIFGLSTNDSFGFRFKLIANYDKTLSLLDTHSESEFSLRTTSKLNIGTWNLVGFEIYYNYPSHSKTVKLVLNDEVLTGSYSDDISMDPLKYFVIGEASPSLVSSDYNKTDTSVESVPTNMPFRLAYASIGSSNIVEDDFIGIYKEGMKYLLEEPSFGASGVTFFNEKVYEGFDVITLNGSLSSLKRMKPKVYSYTDSSFKVDKTRMFKFDTTGQNPLYRHVYASYNSGLNLTKGNYSKLAYDLLLKNKGQLCFRFKLDEIDNATERVILYSVKDGIQKMALFVARDNTIYFQHKSEYNCEVVGYATPGKWQFFGLTFNEDTTKVVLDDEVTIQEVFGIDLEDTYTYFGCAVNSDLQPVMHLNGCIEMIAFKNEYNSNTIELENIRDKGESISVRTYYDELGRTSIKKIHSKDNVLMKNITYVSKDGCTTTKIEQEESYIGENIVYTYDNLEIFEYKDVLEVYNNKTTKLCHIHTETEEIVCTPNHSILTLEGWKLANELTTKDSIKTSTGYVEVKYIEIEHLKEVLNVYNLNVLGYHIYVVGNGLFVVHNACNPDGRKGCQAHQDKISELSN